MAYVSYIFFEVLLEIFVLKIEADPDIEFCTPKCRAAAVGCEQQIFPLLVE